jgi:S1-C subfamily serine protease
VISNMTRRLLPGAAGLLLLGTTLVLGQAATAPTSSTDPVRGETRISGALDDVQEAFDCANQLSLAFQDLSRRVGPAVASISANLPTRGGQLRQVAQGSGVVVTPEGLLVTSHHVVADGTIFRARFDDGREVEAAMLGADPETDLAVLQLEGESFPHAPLSTRAPQRGEFVLALGSPLGLGLSVTTGIVSGLGRKNLGLGITYEDFIQFNSDINFGNSGGPMIDMEGRVIGIVAAISGEEPRRSESRGVSFAIPGEMVRRVADDLVEHGYVRRGYLGVRTRTQFASRGGRGEPGVRVTDVVPGSAAEAAGLLAGDLLISVGGVELRRTDTLLETLAGLAPGTRVAILLEREGERSTVEVELGQRPPVGQD